MKTEAVKTVLQFDYSTSYGDYVVTVDKITELDPEGNAVLSKLLAYVIAPNGDAGVFNYSPYAKLSELHSAVKVWCDCGCPLMNDLFADKWTKDSLHRWVAS